jgi:NADH:ubiquinone oxidoreductase subunit 3 (subunit A)
MILEYGYVFIALLFAIVLAIVFFSISYFGVLRKYDVEKLSAYECGFEPFEDTRSKFDVRFYLVAILFIIFDLEIIYLFPWAIVLDKIDIFGFFVMIVFLFILTVGFIYEWKKGALDWE